VTGSIPYLRLVMGPSGWGIMQFYYVRGDVVSSIVQRMDCRAVTGTSLFEDHIGRLLGGVRQRIVCLRARQVRPIQRRDGGALGRFGGDRGCGSLHLGRSRSHWSDASGLLQIQDGRFATEIADEGWIQFRWRTIPKVASGWITKGVLARYRNGQLQRYFPSRTQMLSFTVCKIGWSVLEATTMALSNGEVRLSMPRPPQRPALATGSTRWLQTNPPIFGCIPSAV